MSKNPPYWAGKSTHARALADHVADRRARDRNAQLRTFSDLGIAGIRLEFLDALRNLFALFRSQPKLPVEVDAVEKIINGLVPQ